MPFSNSLLGQGGGLVRAWIKSPNFVTGVSGWIIRKDGSAEFQNIIARGTIQAGTFSGSNFEINSDGEFFYKAAPALGKLILSVTPDNFAGTDGHGNTVVGGTTSYVDNGVSFDAINFQGGSLNMFNAPTANGAYTLEASIFYATGTALEIVTQLANGNIIIGPAATGTVVFPAGTDPIVANKAGVAETWQSMNTRGYQNGWADSGVGPNGQYRLVPSPANEFEVIGSLTIPVGFAVGQVILNLPAGYHPSAPQPVAGRNRSVTGAQIGLDIAANGNMTWQGATAASAAGNVVDFHGFISKDA
jgi:hypothetical protein